MRQRYSLPLLALALILQGTPAMAEVKKCDDVLAIDQKTTFKADPGDVQQCIQRGYDPPKTWKRDSGKSAGVRASGGGGFSYGTIEAPETPPAKRAKTASVSKNAMESTCNFPPASFGTVLSALIGSGKKGDCLDYLSGLLKAADGQTGTGLVTVQPGACPAESDNQGIFGVKQIPVIGQPNNIPLVCGGMLPLTTYDVATNYGATNLLTTESGPDFYYAWVYLNSNGHYANIANGILLPHCLADRRWVDEGDGGGYWIYFKIADLTPPRAQMIGYNPATNGGVLSLRLQSRATMAIGKIPPYQEGEVEKYLNLPLDGSGVPILPPEVVIDHNVIMAGAPPAEQEQSYGGESCVFVGDGSQQTMFAPPVNNQEIWLFTTQDPGCEGGAAIGEYINGLVCSDGTAPVNGNCASGHIGQCSTNTTPPPDTSCDTVTIFPGDRFGDNVCDGKTQYSVLDRANMSFPASTTANLWPIDGRTAYMAETAVGSMIFMQSQSVIQIGANAPPVTLNEGGFITLGNGWQLIMSPPATVTIGTMTVLMPQGGKLVTGGGTAVQSFGKNAVYQLPPGLAVSPMQIRVGRSITLPAGYKLPTMPQMDADKPNTPYIRLPVPKPAP